MSGSRGASPGRPSGVDGAGSACRGSSRRRVARPPRRRRSAARRRASSRARRTADGRGSSRAARATARRRGSRDSIAGGRSCLSVCVPQKSPAGRRAAIAHTPSSTRSRYPSSPSARSPGTSESTRSPGSTALAVRTTGSADPVAGRSAAARRRPTSVVSAEGSATTIRARGPSSNMPRSGATASGLGISGGNDGARSLIHARRRP